MSKETFPAEPILLVDDEAAFLRSLKMTLRQQGGINNIVTCQNSREVMDLLQSTAFSLVILDLTMPHLSGQELLFELVEKVPEVPVIILSGLNQVDTAVACIKAGAVDYYVKTEEQERLVAGVLRALNTQNLKREYLDLKNHFLDEALRSPEAFEHIITQSPSMQNIFRYIEAVSRSSEPVLITGESGVGKELVAKAVHNVCDAKKPWIAINVAGLDDTVFSDTLFGHIKGSFTGAESLRSGVIEKASDGTLFLDEIGDLGMQSQIKLLRLIQEGEYYPLGSDTPKYSKARFVFSTNVKLEEKLAEGTFRKDLYYRLMTHHIEIPPLRKRPQDVAPLVKYFIEKAALDMDKTIPAYPPQLCTLLEAYSFPGNIRELRGMIYDGVGQHTKGTLSMQAFKHAITNNKDLFVEPQSAEADGLPSGHDVVFPADLPTLNEIANQLVEEALRRSKNNQTLAAQMLGVTRQALGQRIKKMNSNM